MSENNNETKSYSVDEEQNLTLPDDYQNQYLDAENPFVSFVDYSPFLNLLYGDQLM